MTDFLPYGRQVVEDDDVSAVARALRSGWLTTGPEVEAFEAELAAETGAKHAVVCNSGTAALHMALAELGLGLKPGEAAVVPAITFLATANAAIYCGAEVEFADVDPETGLMEPEHVTAAARRAEAKGLKVAAVLPVHLGGQACDIDGLGAAAERFGAMLVEDACHALGGVAGGAAVGACTVGAAACFSFHPVKAIAMGEGGAVTTNDAALAGRMRRFRSHGMAREAWAFTRPDLALDENGKANPWWYEMAAPGMNYRASDLNCALGRSQLKKLGRFTAARAAVVAAYDEALLDLRHVTRPARAGRGAPAWHLYAARVDFEALGMSRAEVMNRLKAEGIGTQVHYIPVAWQPFYRARGAIQDLPGAARYYSRTLSLPLAADMTVEDVGRVIQALAKIEAER